MLSFYHASLIHNLANVSLNIKSQSKPKKARLAKGLDNQLEQLISL